MLSIRRLRPLLCEKLSRKELRCRLDDLIMIINCEHVVGSPTIRARGMRRGVRERVIVVSGLTTSGEKSCERISKPKCAEDVYCGLSSVRIRFRVQERNTGRQSVI